MSSSDGSRFSEYTATDHQAPLWIATSITLAYAGLFLIVRIAVKFKVLSFDDLALGVGHVFGIAQWGVMLAALNNGVGTTNSLQTNAANMVFISRILTLLALGFSKAGVILFLRQIFKGTTKKGLDICALLLIATGVWTVASVLIVSISCAPSGMLSLESAAQCSGDLTRWKVVVAVDVMLEIILSMIPILLFYSVQISRTRKFTIFGAFIPRIIVPAIFIAFLVAYVNFRSNGGTSLDIVSNLIWQEVLCGYSLVSATTPCLKGFLGQFRTRDLTRVTYGDSGTRSYGHNSHVRTNPDNSYVLESMDRTNSTRRPRNNVPAVPLAPPADPLHSATAFAEAFGDNGDGSVKSFGSDRMMIHRKVEFDVSHS